MVSIGGTGCALIDLIYRSVDFSRDEIQGYFSRTPGDGGMAPGKLVFTEDLERFAGKDLGKIVSEAAEGKRYDGRNLGGPSIVSLIHAAQMLESSGIAVSFYGACGDDDQGRLLKAYIEESPLRTCTLKTGKGATPATTVLSDPDYHDGAGERLFLNTIGAAWEYRKDDLDDSFFSHTIQVYGGTGLVPGIHDDLSLLVKKSKDAGAFTVVNTVYDFRNEQRAPDKPWPLVDKDHWKYIDLLIMDAEEARRISGEEEMADAIQFFHDQTVGAVIITEGKEAVWIYAQGELYEEMPISRMPVCAEIDRRLKTYPVLFGDTTGCGDNFAGGVIASIAAQMESSSEQRLSLRQASVWGSCSGGYACFMNGGTYLQDHAGQKYHEVLPYVKAYYAQIGEPGAIEKDALFMEESEEKKRLVQFGAGNIGRSFVGELFSASGWEVVFVDINEKLIAQLNERGSYPVVIKEDGIRDRTIIVSPVRGVLATDEAQVIEEIVSADMIATSVGLRALPYIAPVLRKGILARDHDPVDIILAENIHNGEALLRGLLNLPQGTDESVGVIQTSIGKMVPIMTADDLDADPLAVFSEAYRELILDGDGFVNGVPEVDGLYPVHDISAYVDRKLFIHNLGHAAAAYLGYQKDPEMVYLYEALEHDDIYEQVFACMKQASIALLYEYPQTFTRDDLYAHIEDLLSRFRNRALKDTIYRVGRDLYRKLGPEDRIVGAMKLAISHGCEFDAIAAVYRAACGFAAVDENGKRLPSDDLFIETFGEASILHVAIEVSGFGFMLDESIMRRGVQA